MNNNSSIMKPGTLAKVKESKDCIVLLGTEDCVGLFYEAEDNIKVALMPCGTERLMILKHTMHGPHVLHRDPHGPSRGFYKVLWKEKVYWAYESDIEPMNIK